MSAALAVERHGNAERFLEAAEKWLLGPEAENNLLLGIALNWRGRDPTNPPSYWGTVRAGEQIVGCACRTPPYRLVLSRMPIPAVDLVAADVSAAYESLNGVNGPAAETHAFAVAWTARRGGRSTLQTELRLHELTRVAYSDGTKNGSLRTATQADVVLARDWVGAYVRDTGLQTPPGDYVQRLIERRQLFFWVDGGEPLSMLAATRDTGSGCSINTVYTPQHHRRRGYATAAVAALSDTLLRSGRRFCCLYTDAANPTSNSIYAKVGYRPIRDDVEIAFEQ